MVSISDQILWNLNKKASVLLSIQLITKYRGWPKIANYYQNDPLVLNTDWWYDLSKIWMSDEDHKNFEESKCFLYPDSLEWLAHMWQTTKPMSGHVFSWRPPSSYLLELMLPCPSLFYNKVNRKKEMMLWFLKNWRQWWHGTQDYIQKKEKICLILFHVKRLSIYEIYNNICIL